MSVSQGMHRETQWERQSHLSPMKNEISKAEERDDSYCLCFWYFLAICQMPTVWLMKDGPFSPSVSEFLPRYPMEECLTRESHGRNRPPFFPPPLPCPAPRAPPQTLQTPAVLKRVFPRIRLPAKKWAVNLAPDDTLTLKPTSWETRMVNKIVNHITYVQR